MFEDTHAAGLLVWKTSVRPANRGSRGLRSLAGRGVEPHITKAKKQKRKEVSGLKGFGWRGNGGEEGLEGADGEADLGGEGGGRVVLLGEGLLGLV